MCLDQVVGGMDDGGIVLHRLAVQQTEHGGKIELYNRFTDLVVAQFNLLIEFVVTDYYISMLRPKAWAVCDPETFAM